MGDLRTREMTERYENYKAEGHLQNSCKLCEREPVKTFQYWKIIENKFPYDLIAEVHHMILPLRHVPEPELSEYELAEYIQIKTDYLHKEYEFIIEATHRKKSIPGHFHLHCIIAKD